MVLSTFSTVSLEDVISERKEGQNPYAFQPIFPRDRSKTLDWMRRAESEGLPPYDKGEPSNDSTISLKRIWLQSYFHYGRRSSYGKSPEEEKK